jgi:hypothetical protein
LSWPFLVDIGADGDFLADDALDGEAAAVHLRLDGFDDHAGVVLHAAPEITRRAEED